jgi:dihydropyrimidinase
MKRILIQGGTVVTAGEISRLDLLVHGEKIEALGLDLPAEEAEVIDASGKLIMPGGVDPHTHLDLPMFDTVSSDDHYTGLKAAAFGGTTTVLDFVPQAPGPLQDSIDAWLSKAAPIAAVDFGLHMNITTLEPAVLEGIAELPDMGITSVKVFTAYNGRLRLQDGEIFQVMRAAAEQGLLTMLHAENGDVIEILTAEALAAGHTEPEWHARTRPAWGAVESVLRGIALAEQAGAPLYVVHLNTAGGLDQIRYGRERGVPVMAETCPPYLFFTGRNGSARRPCGPVMTTPPSGKAWRMDRSRRSGRTIVLSSSTAHSRSNMRENPSRSRARSSERRISPRFQTASRASVTACR